MSEIHSVKQGEHLSQANLARGAHGFRSRYLTIWDHPNNAGLKKLRQDPNILLPGDGLFIPDKQSKTLTGDTGMTHVFKVEIPKLELRIALLDFCEQPLASVACALDIEGAVAQLNTDGKGSIRKPIAADSERGAVRLEALDLDYWTIAIGHMDPVEEDSGLRARLRNLGYDAGPLGFDDAGELKSAVEEFQCDHGLKVNGTIDGTTRDKLREVYGC